MARPLLLLVTFTDQNIAPCPAILQTRGDALPEASRQHLSFVATAPVVLRAPPTTRPELMNVQSTAGKHLWKAKDVKKSTPDAHLNANTARTVSGLKERAEVVASIAAETAVTVDRDARFPREAIAAARSQRYGHHGAARSRRRRRDATRRRRRSAHARPACASTAMIYAMHQTRWRSCCAHGRDSPWHQRCCAASSAEQLLLASSTTEGQGGGDVRKSVGAIEADSDRSRSSGAPPSCPTGACRRHRYRPRGDRPMPRPPTRCWSYS